MKENMTPADQSSEAHPISVTVSQVKEFLTAHFDQEISEVFPIGKGQWSKAFAFKRANIDYVIRFGSFKESYEKDRIAARFSSSDLPIPQVSEIGEGLGYHFAISNRLWGEVIDELDAERMQKMIPAIFRMFDAMRGVDMQGTSGFGPWDSSEIGAYQSWHDFLLNTGNDRSTSGADKWRALMEKSSQGMDAFHHIYRRLETLADKCAEDRHLVHTDLSYYNVLVSGDNISAVVDWGNSLYGDFLYDLANFTFWAPWYSSMRNIDWRHEARFHYQKIGLEVPYFEERLRACELHIGLAGMAWNASRESWNELAATAQRALYLAGS